MALTLDDEWSQFLSNNIHKDDSYNYSYHKISANLKAVLETPESKFILQKNIEETSIDEPVDFANKTKPVCEELYISTKTKVLFLNREIDIREIFWNIPILEYWRPEEGVIKKQMKIVSKTQEEYEEVHKKLQSTYYYTENIIKQINNPGARRIKFKDERKITVGMSKKDITNSKIKVKNAFYNCFAIIIRFKHDDNNFKEIHVKIFNTGKLEIPGIMNSRVFSIVAAFR
jgi:hypothetical protein